MTVDAIILGQKFRLYDQRLITHLPQLYQHHIEDGACHIHGESRDRGQHGQLREGKEGIEVRPRQNVANFHQGRLIHEIKFCGSALGASHKGIHQIKCAVLGQKEKDIAHIYDELNRSDSPELKRKVDLIKLFLSDVVSQLDSGESIDEKYGEFEDYHRNKEIQEYAGQNHVNEDALKALISEYEFSGILSEAEVERKMVLDKPLKERRRLRKEIAAYIIDNCKPYVIEDGVAREVDYNSEGVFYVVKGGKTIENIEGYELFNLYEINSK